MRVALGIAGVVLFVTAGMGTVELQGQGGRIEAWAPMPEKPSPFVRSAQAADQNVGCARQAQGPEGLVRGHRQRQPLSRLLHLHGAGAKTRADSSRRTARSGSFRMVVPLHHRRHRAVRCVEGLSRARTKRTCLQHGNGWRHSVAALRGVRWPIRRRCIRPMRRRRRRAASNTSA